MTESLAVTPSHPLGVKPAGNAYTASADHRASAGYFGWLTDDVLVQLLEQLESAELVRTGSTCKALYAFTRLEDLWKSLFVGSDKSKNPFTWRGTWRDTYLNLPPTQRSSIRCPSLFSDVLHRPFYCAHTPLLPYTCAIPKQNGIPRLRDLTVDEFAAGWADKPFILTDPVHEWPVYQTWSTDELLERYGDGNFRAEAVDWSLQNYVEYMIDNQDESPLYLFDRSFVEKMSLKVGREDGGDYWPPACFGEDLFTVLGDQRPDSRWLIVGPERSGSTFHKDPNATSAWNAVLKGAKYWIMFPSSGGIPPPPGVYVSEDQSEVTSPLSIAEWLLGFHAEARKTKGCLEGICREGEVLHVPSGWWHLVVNLSGSIAITQNFVPRTHLKDAIGFLRDKPDQVSGFKKGVTNPHEVFVDRLREQQPDLLDKALGELARREEGRKRKWDEVVHSDRDGNSGRNGAGFSFGFNAGDDEDDDIP